MQLSNWLVSRVARTAVVATLFVVLLCLLLFRYPDFHERIADLKEFDLTAQQPVNASPDLETAPMLETTATPSESTPASSCDCPSAASTPTEEPLVRWSDFAYVQYVTNGRYLCNSLMIFEALRRFKTRADLLMMYPDYWSVPSHAEEHTRPESKLLAQARDEYGAKLVPIQVRTFVNRKDPTWQDSYTKLLAFNQTQYKRVISLDSDATVLNHMDELFLLPPSPVAMPRAYWMDKFFLSSQLIVIQPSDKEWARVDAAIEHHEGWDYDMDILNKLYLNSSMVIPHLGYDLLTGEFGRESHGKYLAGTDQEWDAKRLIEEAKFVHFSDWPMPKPWLQPLDGMVEKHQPKCRDVTVSRADGEEEIREDCSDREVWLELREDFADRRERVCGRRYDALAPRPSNKRSTYEPMFE